MRVRLHRGREPIPTEIKPGPPYCCTPRQLHSKNNRDNSENDREPRDDNRISPPRQAAPHPSLITQPPPHHPPLSDLANDDLTDAAARDEVLQSHPNTDSTREVRSPQLTSPHRAHPTPRRCAGPALPPLEAAPPERQHRHCSKSGTKHNQHQRRPIHNYLRIRQRLTDHTRCTPCHRQKQHPTSLEIPSRSKRRLSARTQHLR